MVTGLIVDFPQKAMAQRQSYQTGKVTVQRLRYRMVNSWQRQSYRTATRQTLSFLRVKEMVRPQTYRTVKQLRPLCFRKASWYRRVMPRLPPPS